MKEWLPPIWDIDKKEAGADTGTSLGRRSAYRGFNNRFGETKQLKTYRMHDLFHDIARHYLTLSPETKNVTDLPGFGLKFNEANNFLLNRYQSKTQKKGLWHTLENDAYIHNHLTWHMEKAERVEDIHKLLSEENENGNNGWYEALESLGLNAVFIEDVIRAWSLSEKESKTK